MRLLVQEGKRRERSLPRAAKRLLAMFSPPFSPKRRQPRVQRRDRRHLPPKELSQVSRTKAEGRRRKATRLKQRARQEKPETSRLQLHSRTSALPVRVQTSDNSPSKETNHSHPRRKQLHQRNCLETAPQRLLRSLVRDKSQSRRKVLLLHNRDATDSIQTTDCSMQLLETALRGVKRLVELVVERHLHPLLLLHLPAILHRLLLRRDNTRLNIQPRNLIQRH